MGIFRQFIRTKVEATLGKTVCSFVRRHQLGENSIKRAFGLYVCSKCNYSQIKQFACCPRCRHPRPGLFIKKN